MPWTYVSPISTRLLVGTLTPAIRAISRSPLPLLVARVRADNEDAAAPPDHPATLAHRLYGRSYLHPLLAGRIQSVSGEGPPAP